ncbi:cytochrome P450 [Pseudonocardia halophobica]|uniref:Cytochrome P450 n=1 Tax=Pseudonocardia halophobica TaxID=29401 RepID=A0A9W6L9U9_9PSEU|nr:cytochrome P450 [Pseudonocardia halophobica]GLL13434.1 cytochrome P450 [Pseudonocardia halophobica]
MTVPGIDSVDLTTPSASADPFSVFRALREGDPVHWSEAHRAWLITRYDDVSAAFQNKAFSNDRVRPVLERKRQAGAESAATGVLGLMTGWMVVNDPPVHTRLRKLAAGAFKGQRIAAMDEMITRIVDEHLDAFLRGSGPQDLISEVAYPLPATVIATMLGAPPEDRDRFREWSDELALVAFGTGGAARADRHERALRGLREMESYFHTLIGKRRAEPGEDMLSALMAKEGDDRLTDDELVGMCALLLFAGHETTTNSIANSVLALLRHPDQLDRLRRDPALIGPAVEELLRFDGPIKVLNRWVVAETEVRGKTIRPGERVHLVLASANRDPEKFADPDTLDLGRSPNPHVAFGKGIHACIGAQLARMETRIAVARIVERLPGLALAEEPEWKDVLASRSMEKLVVTHS